VRRLDPKARRIGQYLQDELAGPLGADFYIGLPPGVPDSRIANLKTFGLFRLFSRMDQMPILFTLSFMNPRSLASRSMMNPTIMATHANFNTRELRAVECASGTGIGSARAIARLYSAFAGDGAELDLRQETLDALRAPAVPPSRGIRDKVLQTDVSFSLGFFKPWAGFRFGTSGQAFGVPGAGGSFGYADPDAHIAFGYTPNRMDVYFADDPRHKALRGALERSLKGLGSMA